MAASLQIDDLVARTGSLYSLPMVAVEVLELTNSPKVDAAKLKACIERDPALTIKILKVVNSSLFGLSRQVSDLHQAIALLGVKPLKLLVLGFSLPDALFAELAGDVLDRYWQRTLTRAVAARELAEQLWKIPGDEAFIAGLLEDLGQLVLLQELGEAYVGLLRRITSSGDYLRALEQHAVGFDHVALSGRLLAAWGLPESLIEAIQHDESAGESADDAGPPLPRILHLADLLTRALIEGRDDILPIVLALGRKWRRLDAAQLDQIVTTLQDKVAQLADVLSLRLPADSNYQNVMIAAQRRLADVAEQAAFDLLTAQREALGARLDSMMLLDEVQALAAEAEQAARHGRSRSKAAGPTQARNAPPASAARAQSHVRPTPHSATDMDRAVDPSFLARLAAAVNAARQARCPLSLLLVELDHYADAVFLEGAESAERLLLGLESLCRGVDHPHVVCEQASEARFGVILFDCDRRQAVQAGDQLLRSARALWRAEGIGSAAISIGASTVALPPRNFPPVTLVESADRCLFGAQSHGGNTLKSIEIY